MHLRLLNNDVKVQLGIPLPGQRHSSSTLLICNPVCLEIKQVLYCKCTFDYNYILQYSTIHYSLRPKPQKLSFLPTGIEWWYFSACESQRWTEGKSIHSLTIINNYGPPNLWSQSNVYLLPSNAFFSMQQSQIGVVLTLAWRTNRQLRILRSCDIA